MKLERGGVQMIQQVHKRKRGAENRDRLVLRGTVVQEIDSCFAVDPPLTVGAEAALTIGQALGHGVHHVNERRLWRLGKLGT